MNDEQEPVKPLAGSEKLKAVLMAARDRDLAIQEIAAVTMARLRLVVQGSTALSLEDDSAVMEIAIETLSEVIDHICRLTAALTNVVDEDLINLCISTMRVGLAGAEALDGPEDKLAEANYRDAIKILEFWKAMATEAPDIIIRMSEDADKYYEANR